MKVSPFDHRRDHELGNALRSALTGRNEAEFVQRVVDGAAELQRGVYGREWWEILSGWARPGLAAAAVGLVAAATLWWSASRDQSDTAVALGDPLRAAVEIPAPFLAAQPPDLNEVLALELGN